MADRPHLELGNYLPYLINRVGFAMVASFTGTIEPHGLTIDMWRVLAALSNNGGQRQVDLSSMTSIDVSTMSRLVTRLVRAGLATRSRSEQSSREVVVSLSPEGAHAGDAAHSGGRGAGADRERRPVGQGHRGGKALADADARKSFRKAMRLSGSRPCAPRTGRGSPAALVSPP